ncbi:MAG: condensation domain-containing protein [Candidatus Korobacteraceae bacterium]|jgi:hypothetical protein
MPSSELSETKRQLLARYLRGDRSVESAASILACRPAGKPACLSVAQECMWRHMRENRGLTCYNEPITVYRRGSLDVSLLERSFTELVQRHEAWRTTFTEVDGEPVQVIHEKAADVVFAKSDIRHLVEAEREGRAIWLASQDACIPIDLERGPLFRTRLVRLADDEYRLFATVHHIILDGVTVFDIFFSELVAFYNALSAGEAPVLPELPVQFADFAYWHRQRLRGELLNRELAYWRRQLAAMSECSELPTDFPRPLKKTYRGAIQSFALTKAESDALRNFSQRQSVTVFTILVAAFVALLYRHGLQRDITVGTVTPGGRKNPQLQHVMGLLQNRVPLRIDLAADPTIRELLVRVRDVISESLCHDDVPFEIIAGELWTTSDSSRSPFFQTMISLEPRVPDVGPGWGFTTMDAQPGGARLDLYIEIDDRPEGMLGRAQYNSDLFTEETILRIVRDLRAMLVTLIANPEERLSALVPPTVAAFGGPIAAACN